MEKYEIVILKDGRNNLDTVYLSDNTCTSECDPPFDLFMERIKISKEVYNALDFAAREKGKKFLIEKNILNSRIETLEAYKEGVKDGTRKSQQ